MTDDIARLEKVITARGPICVAVSGGVDSMTLAHVAHRIRGSEMVHAVSPAVPPEATARVERHGEAQGWALRVVGAGEFDDPRYVTNPVNRCFFCKTNLYQRIAGLTDLPIASGANTDDLGDYRPGLLAARDHQVIHPLIEAGIDKAGVRRIARALGLEDLAELPAQPCLSSRVETGIAIDARDLAFIDLVETRVRAEVPQGTTVRCRILREGVVLEVDLSAEDNGRLEGIVRDEAERDGRRFAGLRPYRRGSAFLTGTLSAP